MSISPSQKQFSAQSILLNYRADGRKNQENRQTTIKTDVLDQLSGSSYVFLEYENIEIYTGIKIKIQECPFQVIQQQNQPIVILELSSMRKLIPAQNSCLVYMQELLQDSYINKSLSNFSRLRIKDCKKNRLEMHIQTFILNQPHLSLLEPIFLSISKALQTAQIPQVTANFNELTNEETTELTGNIFPLQMKHHFSIKVLGILEGRHVFDMSQLEYEAVEAVILLTIKDSKIIHFQNLKGSIKVDEIHRISRLIQNKQQSI